MKAGGLGAMIPEAYGGAGLGLIAASVIMEEVAPISTNLIFSYVAEHLLGLPRSY